MLLLIFQLGADRYAVDSAQVVEVLPRLEYRPLPQAVQGVAGIFNYHGRAVPLIDLAQLALGQPSRARMSTRIILVNYREPSGDEHLLGLLAERTTETLRRTEAEFTESGVAVDDAAYLGRVTTDAMGLVQRVKINRLLPASVRDVLFRQPLEPA